MPPSSHLPPYHGQQQQQQQQQHQIPHNIAYGVTEALRNPYAQPTLSQFHNPYSAHYANAYMQSQQARYTMPEGYTLSSTYDPHAATHNPAFQQQGRSAPSSSRGRGFAQQKTQSNPPRQPTQHNGSWYHAGTSHCTYPTCTFAGSSKSVEVHMMDRHLIYPPGWDKKKKGPDWDADPSLKGKMVPIQGTSIVLNTPEALDAWIAERRKRWPTAHRVEEKKAKMEEAIARGQLPLMGSNSRGMKRRREEGQDSHRNKKRFNRNDAQKKKESQVPRIIDQQVQNRQLTVPLGRKAPIVTGQVVQYSDSDDSVDDDNGAPEIVSSKQPQAVEPTDYDALNADIGEEFVETTQPTPPEINQTSTKVPPKPRKREPRLPPQNPFASRPTLLRNLLLPEIRMTISNLSQAIRFLVDNDFLRNVELSPGEANRNFIEVLDSQPIGLTESVEGA